MRRSVIQSLKKNLRTLNLSRAFVPTIAEQEYFDWYRLNVPGTEHGFGVLTTRTSRLAVQVFRPKNYRAAVVCVHGYLEHCGYFSHAVKKLAAEGFAVILFDLPGHGLSSGTPAAVHDFAQYAEAVKTVVRFSCRRFKVPVHMLAHSMGGSIALELAIQDGLQGIDKVILAAPLVHTKFWQATRAAYRVLLPAVQQVPRAFPVISSDKEFMKFTLEGDPLLRKKIPLAWVTALFRWNERFEKYQPLERKLLLIQGTADRLVDGEYAIAALKKKFPHIQVKKIRNANHQLFNEAPKYRAQVLKAITAYLSGI